jgi:hypothetical protein
MELVIASSLETSLSYQSVARFHGGINFHTARMRSNQSLSWVNIGKITAAGLTNNLILGNFEQKTKYVTK